MRKRLAHILRWLARWQMAVSNRLLPPREATENERHRFAEESIARGLYIYRGGDLRLGWIDAATRTGDPFATRYHLAAADPADAAAAVERVHRRQAMSAPSFFR